MTATASERIETGEAPAARKGPTFGTRDDLLRGPKLKHRDVYVERLDKHFRLRELRQGELEDIRKQLKADSPNGEPNSEGFVARMIACAMVNPDGSQMFMEPHKDYLALGRALTPDVLEQLWEAGDEMWLLSPEAKKATGKSSERTQES